MAQQFTTLIRSQYESFQQDGYVFVRQAFAPADALAIEQQWWDELESVHGIQRADPSTWQPVPSDLKGARTHPLQARILSHRVHGVLDDLLGAGSWARPKDWGRTIATFPEAGEWNVPTGFWHWDNVRETHVDSLRGLFVVTFIGPVAPRGGGTLLLIPIRVVELTGQPADMVFCHSLMVHCVSPNRGEWPRFMCIRQQLPQTRRGRK